MVSPGSTLEDLQALIAYNEKMITDLSEVVVAQGRDIEKLRAELELLGRQVLQIAESEADSPPKW
jgi:uncharacterized coiled-coil protein SlyX